MKAFVLLLFVTSSFAVCFAQSPKTVLLPASLVQDKTDTLNICADPSAYRLTIDASNYRSGISFWSNFTGNFGGRLIADSVPYGQYNNFALYQQRALAIYPLPNFSNLTIRNKLRTDFNEYRFRIIQLNTPENFEKDVIFRHYPSLPTNKTINDYITTTSADTLVACVERAKVNELGIAIFELPFSKIDPSMDARIKWGFFSGAGNGEILQLAFAPQDARQTIYSIANIPMFGQLSDVKNNEKIYVLTMRLERPISGVAIDGACEQSEYKTIVLKLFERPEPPNLITGDTLWYCADAPFQVPIQIDKNYPSQFVPEWRFFRSTSDQGFNNDPSYPYVQEPSQPGTYLVGVTKASRSGKTVTDFNKYLLSVRFFNSKCATATTNLTVMVGDRADDARLFDDTVYSCGLGFVDGIRFHNVGVAAGTVGSSFFSKVSGPNGFSFSTRTKPGSNDTGLLRIDNLDVPQFTGQVNKYVFVLNTQNRQCPIQSNQRDTLRLNIVSSISTPVLQNPTRTTSNGFVKEIYVSNTGDEVPLLLRDESPFTFDWEPSPTNPSTVSKTVSISDKNRFLFKGFDPLSSGVNTYLLNVSTIYPSFPQCRSDVTPITVNVNLGSPLVIQSVEVYKQKVTNYDMLDTIVVCTNGDFAYLKPRKPELGYAIKFLSNGILGNFINFKFKTKSDASGSDTAIEFSFDPLQPGSPYFIIVNYSLQKGTQQLENKNFVLKISGSINTNPVPDTLTNLFFCAQPSFILGGLSRDIGVWRQIAGREVKLEEPSNFNTEVTEVIRPTKDKDYIRYAFEWVAENGFCPKVYDTQYVTNLPALSVPSIDKITRLDATNTELYSRIGATDTVCLSVTPTETSAKYRIIASKVDVGTAKWVFNGQLSSNVKTVPSITSNVFSDSLLVNVAFPPSNSDSIDIVYVFERQVYHLFPVGCDTIKQYAYVIIEKNTFRPSLIDGRRLLYVCPNDNEVTLQATPTGKNVRWSIIPDFVKDRYGHVAGNTQELTPTLAESLNPTFVGFAYHAFVNAQTKLDLNKNDSFSVQIEMTMMQNYCRFRKDTIELRFLNKPSTAAFKLPDPLMLCNTSNTLTDIDIQKVLADTSIPIKIGYRSYQKIFSGTSYVPAVDSQVWEYRVAHGGCDTSKTTKIVYIQKNSDIAKILKDTLYVCYDQNGVSNLSPIYIYARRILPSSIGRWNILNNGGNVSPSLSGVNDTMLTLSGSAINLNLATSANRQALYKLEWNVLDACNNLTRDTILVLHYGIAPYTALSPTLSQVYGCAEEFRTRETNLKTTYTLNKTWWSVSTFIPEQMSGGSLLPSSPLQYNNADTLKDGQNLGWASKDLLYRKPLFSSQNDTTTKVTFAIYPDYEVSYLLQQKVQNGDECPILNIGSTVDVRGVYMHQPTLNISGYDKNQGGSIVLCPSATSYNLNFVNGSQNFSTNLEVSAWRLANTRFEIVNALNKQLSINSSGMGVASYDFSAYTSEYSLSPISIKFSTINGTVNSSQRTTENGCLLEQFLQLYVYDNAYLKNQISTIGLGRIDNAYYRYCKGSDVSDSILIRNPLGTKFVLWKRPYNTTYQYWQPWVAVDSSINKAHFRGFKMGKLEEDSVQFRVTAQFRTIEHQGTCKEMVNIPVSGGDTLLPGVVTVGAYESASNPSVGTLSMNGNITNSVSVCLDAKEKVDILISNISNFSFVNPIVYKWQQGVGSTSLGTIVWQDIYETEQLPGISVSSLNQPTYFRAVFETNNGNGCYAFSPVAHVDILKGSGNGCTKVYGQPGLSPSGVKEIKRYQFFGDQSGCAITGFNFDVPFEWNTNRVATRTGIAPAGSTQNKIQFKANKNNTLSVISDTIIFTRVLAATEVARSQDTLIAYIDIIPLRRLNADLNGGSVLSTSIAGSEVLITSLNPLVNYTWRTISSKPAVTGIASIGSGKGPVSFITNSTERTLRDTILFIKDDPQYVQFNNSLDTVVVYIQVLPEDKLAINDDTRYVNLVKKSGQSVVLDRFVPGKSFDWRTKESLDLGITTGTGKLGLPHSGTGTNKVTFTAANNLTDTIIKDTVRFVSATGTKAAYLDTLFYIIQILPEPHLHQNPSKYVSVSMLIKDSVNIGDYINKSVPYQWNTQPSGNISYRPYPFTSSKSTASNGSGMNGLIYFAPTSINQESFIDTIWLTRNLGGAFDLSNDKDKDTLYFVARVYQAPHLNSNDGVYKVDTFYHTIFHGGNLNISSPQISSGVTYQWNTLNKSGATRTSIASSISTSVQGDFVGGAVTIKGSNVSLSVQDTFRVFRVGSYASYNDYRDTVILILRVLPISNLVNINQPGTVKNTKGYYTRSITFPYPISGNSSDDYSYLVNFGVNYRSYLASVDASGNIKTGTRSTTYVYINDQDITVASFSGNQSLILQAFESQTSVALNKKIGYGDTILLVRDGNFSLTSADSLLLFINVNDNFYLRPSYIPKYFNFQTDYKSKDILIGNNYISSSTPFRFWLPRPSYVSKLLSSSSVNAYTNTTSFQDSIRLKIEENTTSQNRVDTFYIASTGGSDDTFDTLWIVINQLPPTRLRREGFSKVFTKNMYDNTDRSTFFIKNQINPGVTFASQITGTGSTVIGTTTRDSLAVTPSISGNDVLLLYRTSEPTLAMTDQDSIYFILTNVSDDRLRKINYQKEKKIYIPQSSSPTVLTVDDELNPYVYYNVRLNNLSVFDSVSYDGGKTYSKITTNSLPTTNRGILRLKTRVNGTSTILRDTVYFTRAVNVAGNNTQDTFIVNAELASTYCAPVSFFGLDTVQLQVKSGGKLTLTPLITAGNRGWVFNGGRAPRVLTTLATSQSASSTLTAANLAIVSTSVPLIDTIVVHSGTCNTVDKKVVIIQCLPIAGCKEGIDEGTRRTMFIAVNPSTTGMSLRFPRTDGQPTPKISYIFNEQNPGFNSIGDVINLDRPSPASPNSDTIITYNTFQNDFPLTLYDTLKVFILPQPSHSCGTAFLDTIDVIIGVNPTTRLRPEKSSKYLNFEVYEGDTVSVLAGTHINTFTPPSTLFYSWRTQSGTSKLGTPGALGNSVSGTFRFKTVNNISQDVVDTILFSRYFSPSSSELYGNFDSLYAEVRVKPSLRMTYSKMTTIDEFIFDFDYKGGQTANLKKELRPGLSFTATQQSVAGYSRPSIQSILPSSSTILTKDSFAVTIGENTSDSVRKVIFELKLVGTTSSDYKNTVRVIINQAPKQDYLRKYKSPMIQYKYLNGAKQDTVLIKPEILQGIPFNFNIKGAGFANVGGSRTGTNILDSLNVIVTPGNLTTARVDSIILYKQTVSTTKPSQDSFILVVVQTPIIRLRKMGFDKVQYSPVTTSWLVSDPINAQVPFGYQLLTGNGVVTGMTQGTTVSNQENTLTITSNINLTNQSLSDTVLLFREGLSSTFSQQDTIILIITKPPFSRLRDAVMRSYLEFDYYGGELLRLDGRYLKISSGYNYTITNNGAVNTLITPLTGSGSTSLDINMGINKTTGTITDTINVVRQTNASSVNTLNSLDSLKIVIRLHPLRRLRKVYSSKIKQIDITPETQQTILINKELNLAVNFKRLNEFPSSTYRDSFVRIVNPNTSNAIQVISDTLVRITDAISFGVNNVSTLNDLDTLIVNINVKPIPRLRRADVPRVVYLSYKALDSVLVDKTFITQGVIFGSIYNTSSAIIKPTLDYFAPNSRDSIKFYLPRNLSSVDEINVIHLYRRGTNISSQDSITIYVRVNKQSGLHVSNAKSSVYALRTGNYLKFQEFNKDKYYTYQTTKYSSLLNRERVIDSNDANNRLTPPLLSATGNYFAKADTSLSFPIYDTIVFINTDASGVPQANADIPTSVDTFYLYVTLLPINLTDGQRYSTQQYRSSSASSYSKFLNEGIEFNWSVLSSSSTSTGFPSSGSGVDSVSFTTPLNITRSPWVDVVRFIKKFGSNLSFRDTLTTEIVLSPVPRLWDKRQIDYYVYSDTKAVLDSFFLNVPFTWIAQGTSGLDTVGSGTNAVYFHTATNNTPNTLIDTAIFVKKVDGEPRGTWDTLYVYIHLQPKIKLYSLVEYPYQVAQVQACSQERVVFRGMQKGIPFRAYSRTLTVAPTGVDSLVWNTLKNSSTTKDRLDTIILVRSPLRGDNDCVLPDDSLIIQVKTMAKPEIPNILSLNTSPVCPGTTLSFKMISVEAYKNILGEIDKRYDIYWLRDGSLISVGNQRPNIKFGVLDTVRLSLTTFDRSCPKVNGDTLKYVFTSDGLPELNLRWHTGAGQVQYALSDTLFVCGEGEVFVENKSINAAKRTGLPTDTKALRYTWSSPRIQGITNNFSSPEFSFDAPSLIGTAGETRTSDTFAVSVIIEENDENICFSKTINTALIVKRIPNVNFDIPDTICLPHLLYPINMSTSYDPIVYKWSINDFMDTIIGYSPAIELTKYVDQKYPGLLDGGLQLTLSASSSCGKLLTNTQPIHVIKKMNPQIKFDPQVSYMDTICISSLYKDYFKSLTYYPIYLNEPGNIAYHWFVNDSLKGNEVNLNTNLNQIIRGLNFVDDSIRFVIQTKDDYRCYATVTLPMTVIKGVVRPEDKPFIDHQYHNYCPPARLSFSSNMINATKWTWYDNGQEVSVLKLSENVKESTFNNSAKPEIVSADTNYLNNYIIRNLGINTMGLVVNNDFRLCPADSVMVNFKVYDYPSLYTPQITVPPNSGNILCLPENITFETFVKSKDTTIRRYFWSMNDESFTEIVNDSSYTRFITKNDLPDDGAIAINEYVIDVNQCKSLVASTPVDQQEEPVAHFFYKDICLGDTFYVSSSFFTKTKSSDSDKILEWDMGDGTTYSSLTQADANSIKHYFNKEGEYKVRLIARYTNENCGADTFIANIKVYAPINVEIKFPNLACVNTPVVFDVTSDNSLDTIQNYLWDFSGNPDLQSSEKNPTRYFSNPGNFVVKLVATSKYCNVRDSAIQDLIISVPVRSGRNYDDIYVLKDQPFSMYAEVGGLSYEWNHKLYLDNPVIYNPLGKVDGDTKFEVRINFNGCYVTDYQNVKIVDKTNVIASSAFTPNGDGANDEFGPLYVGINTLNYFKVYDASGREIFSTSSPFEKWNGTYKGGEKMPTGVYKWVVNATDKDNKVIMNSGAVLLAP